MVEWRLFAACSGAAGCARSDDGDLRRLPEVLLPPRLRRDRHGDGHGRRRGSRLHDVGPDALVVSWIQASIRHIDL